MNKYYFTFGQRYKREPHLQGGHPDGWFTIQAHTEAEARQKMVSLCGSKWATSYDTEPDRKTFPLGELKFIP
jgi:hypothetical protein